MCFTNKNTSTTILLLLLCTFPSATMITINSIITTPTATPTKMITTTNTTWIISSEKRRQQQKEEQDNIYKNLGFLAAKADTPPPMNFDVKLRGTLPLHKDNFIASLVNDNRLNFYNESSKSNIYKNIYIAHSQYYNSLNPVVYDSIDAHVERGKSLLPVVTSTSTTIATPVTTYPPPAFDYGVPRNITARAGQIASITCRVDNLGDKSVSWIRKRDLHILTAGILTYTSDDRFKVLRTADSRSWSLHVKYVQRRDSGIYECQVSTEPKKSMSFRLNVIVTPPDAKAIILGPTDLYVKVGSVITLTCHVMQPSSAHDIGPIYWYRGPYVLTPFEIHSNDAAIDLQRISMESKLVEQLQSRLRIVNAQTIDSDNYTCMPTTAEAASVTVNVINDESPAAMQKSSSRTIRITTKTFKKIPWYMLNIIFFMCHYFYYDHHMAMPAS